MFITLATGLFFTNFHTILQNKNCRLQWDLNSDSRIEGKHPDPLTTTKARQILNFYLKNWKWRLWQKMVRQLLLTAHVCGLPTLPTEPYPSGTNGYNILFNYLTATICFAERKINEKLEMSE